METNETNIPDIIHSIYPIRVIIHDDISHSKGRHSCESSPRRSPLSEAEGSLGRNPKNTGFPRIKYGAGLVEPGMTNRIRLISSCIAIIRVIRRGCHSSHLTSVKKSFRRIAFVKDLPIAEVDMPMDDQV
jgi:hypothetical protein